MNIYLVTLDPDTKTPNGDDAVGVVVAAQSYTAARKLAASAHGDEGEDVWLDIDQSTVTLIGFGTINTEAGIILRSYNAA